MIYDIDQLTQDWCNPPCTGEVIETLEALRKIYHELDGTKMADTEYIDAILRVVLRSNWN